jgi:ferredoxin-thioredoxin reductase catalytic chain
MPASEKSAQDTRRFVGMVAQHRGWQLMTDPEFLDTLVAGLTTNYNRYGYYLCPCRDTRGSREADRDVLCPCEYAAPDIAEHGRCYCALYQSAAFQAEGREPRQIPERRPEQG